MSITNFNGFIERVQKDIQEQTKILDTELQDIAKNYDELTKSVLTSKRQLEVDTQVCREKEDKLSKRETIIRDKETMLNKREELLNVLDKDLVVRESRLKEDRIKQSASILFREEQLLQGIKANEEVTKRLKDIRRMQSETERSLNDKYSTLQKSVNELNSIK